MKARSILVILFSVFVILTGCYKEPMKNQVGVIGSYFPEMMEYSPGGDAYIATGTRDPSRPETPKPIPGRILVKIKQIELAETYTLNKKNRTCNIKELQKRKLIPSSIPITEAIYLGQTLSGRHALRLRLAKPMDRNQLQEILSNNGLLILNDLSIKDLKTDVDVTVEIGSDPAKGYFEIPCKTDYYYLKDKSSLHRVFTELGVQSMRRDRRP